MNDMNFNRSLVVAVGCSRDEKFHNNINLAFLVKIKIIYFIVFEILTLISLIGQSPH